MLLIPIGANASSTEELEYMFKTSNQSIISRPCFNAAISSPGGWCSNTTVCQLTITDPTNKVIIAGQNMTNQISFYNYTLPLLATPGIYKADMACNDNNLTGYDSFFFGINQAGQNYNGSIAPYVLLTILIALTVLFAYLGFKMEQAMRLVFLTTAILLVPISLWVGLDIARNSFMGDSVINVLATGFFTSLVCFVGFVFYVLISLTMQLKINKTMSIPNNKASPYYWQKKKEYKEKHQGEEYD
jgi:uncharacterized membrane protein